MCLSRRRARLACTAERPWPIWWHASTESAWQRSSIAPGRGRKATYLLSARAQIVATAQREPDRRTDGTATWSLSTLQRALRRAGLPRVGTSTIRRVLQEAGSSYQRTRTWCPTGTAQRKRKSGVVTVVDPKTEEKRS